MIAVMMLGLRFVSQGFTKQNYLVPLDENILQCHTCIWLAFFKMKINSLCLNDI